MAADQGADSSFAAFALVYFTFFLDNVLLTVLVPIIPDWVRGGELARWAQEAPAPLAALLNHTVRHATAAAGNRTHDEQSLVESVSRGGSTAIVGAVLGAKAAAQLAAAPWAARAVCRRGPARALAAGCALLAAAAAVFAACPGRGAACAGAGRLLHGAGSALAGVAGLALVATAAPHRLPTLLGAVALGVLVGYPAGGVLDAAPSFLLLAAALLLDLALQYLLLRKEEFNRPTAAGGAWRGARAAAAAAPAGACAGCVLLTTSVMAALEPTLPPWIRERFHPQRWQTGAVFVPDSAGYLAATAGAGAAARALGAERVALAGQLAVGLAALALPAASSVWWLVGPHAALGAGLGAADAALQPALLARAPRRVPHLAALLQAASSAAYALGPALGGALAWSAGFAAALRALGAANLLYAAYLYTHLRRHPLSPQVRSLRVVPVGAGPALGGALAWSAGFAAALRALGAANLLYAAYLYTHLRRHPLSPQVRSLRVVPVGAGPALGGALAWSAGFAAALRALGAANLLYAAYLYTHLRRHPLSPQVRSLRVVPVGAGPALGGALAWSAGFAAALRALGAANLLYAAYLYTHLRRHPLSPQVRSLRVVPVGAGPALGGALAWSAGFAAALRALGAANLLYAAYLYTHLRRHPLSPQWGACTPDEEEEEAGAGEGARGEDAPLRPRQYVPLR